MAKAEEVKVEDQVETPVEGAEGLEEGAGGPESISLNDLQLLAQIVDLASQRGVTILRHRGRHGGYRL